MRPIIPAFQRALCQQVPSPTDAEKLSHPSFFSIKKKRDSIYPVSIIGSLYEEVNSLWPPTVHDIPCFSLRAALRFQSRSAGPLRSSCLCLLLPTVGPPSPKRRKRSRQ